jgi:hypothetical protein
MILQVPLTISGNKVSLAGTPAFGKPGSTAKALEKSKDRLTQLKLQLKAANLAYKKAPSAINLKKIENLKAQMGGLSKIVKKQAKGAVAEAKNKLKVLRQKIKDTRKRLKSAAVKAKKPIQIRLDGLVNKVFSMRISSMQAVLNKNRSNVAAMRRSRLRTSDQLKALAAKIKRLTIPNPVLNMQRLKMNASLKKINLDLKKSLIRQKKIIKSLNKLKAKKNVYNSRRNLQKAAAGAMGSIPQALNSIRDMLKRHEKILRTLAKKRKGGLRKTRRPKRKCGNMKLARRRLKNVVGMIVKLKKTPASPARDKRLAKLRTLAKKRKVALRRIIKCKGLTTCGNLKKAKRNLAKAKSNLAKANKKAKERPSDEGAQRARKKFIARIKVHRKMIQKIWRCICRQAVKKYRQYKKLYAKKKSPVYLRKMNIHKKMIKTCNCRKARINFNRARNMHKKSTTQYMQNAKNTKAKDNIAVFYKRMIVHRNKLKSLGCKKLPVMPAPPSGLVKKKFILKKRR